LCKNCLELKTKRRKKLGKTWWKWYNSSKSIREIFKFIKYSITISIIR